MTDDTKYYAFALATTREARAELRAVLLGRLADAVEVEVEERGECRDTNPQAAIRVRPWRLG